jgi:LacI family transcriptional regulator
VKSTHPHPYVGLDNRCAGQTAAYLMAQWLGPQTQGTPVDVLVSSSGQRFQGEEERIQAFVQALAQQRPACTVHVLDTGLGLYGPTVAAVGRLLRQQPGAAAVYSVGGANAAILAAFDQAQRACHPFIGHDLDDDNLALLRTGRLSAVLHHDLQHDLHMACWHFMHAQGALRGAQAVRPSNVEVITPFNLPAGVAGISI